MSSGAVRLHLLMSRNVLSVAYARTYAGIRRLEILGLTLYHAKAVAYAFAYAQMKPLP